MRAHWPYNRCILCLEARLLTDEHLIPESLAGRLISAFLCRSCNSSLGHRYEHAARQDPTVRLLANQLHEVIPHIASAMAENQTHVAIGPGPGTKTGFVKNGEFHITPRQEADGSLIQTTPAAKGTIARMLQKGGYNAHFIADALQRLDGAPDNVEVEITPAIRVVKWEIRDVKLALTGPPIDPVVPVKTAYEFLALHMGSAVYGNSPPLEETRRVLQGGQLDPQWLSTLRATPYFITRHSARPW